MSKRTFGDALDADSDDAGSVATTNAADDNATSGAESAPTQSSATQPHLVPTPFESAPQFVPTPELAPDQFAAAPPQFMQEPPLAPPLYAVAPPPSSPPQPLADMSAHHAAALAVEAALASTGTAADALVTPASTAAPLAGNIDDSSHIHNNIASTTTTTPTGATKRQKKGNIFLTNEQRQALCIRAATEKATQTQLCVWAQEAFGLTGPLHQSTVSRILAEKDKYIAIDGSTLSQKRKTHVEHPVLEAALAHWLLVASHRHQRIQGDVIKDKGKAFARLLGIEHKISFSNGWLTGFKKRHALVLAPASASTTSDTSALSTGSAASDAASVTAFAPAALSTLHHAIDAPSAEFGVWGMQHLLQEYNARDIFSVDETGLLFAIEPEKQDRQSASAESSDATRDSSSWHDALRFAKLTLLLAVNADGSERLDPVFLGRSKHLALASRGVAGIATQHEQHQLQVQRDLQAVKTLTTSADSSAAATSPAATTTNVPFHYCYSARPWLNAVVFQRWLNTLNAQMKIANRHILLVMDDAPVHITRGLRLTNIRVLQLPNDHLPNAQQPFDAGITLAFKRRYRKRQLVHALDRLEAGDSDVFTLDEVQAMKWCRAAWLDVPQDVIVKSWLQSHLFGAPLQIADGSGSSSNNGAFGDTEDALDSVLKDLASKLLPLKRVMAPKELLRPFDENESLHFVGATESDFLAVHDELPIFQFRSTGPNSRANNNSNNNSSSNNSIDMDSSSSADASGARLLNHVDHTTDDCSLHDPQHTMPLLATRTIDDLLLLRATADSAQQQQQQQQQHLPDDDAALLQYIQKLVPNLERLGCDERTIDAMRDVRQTLKQRLLKHEGATMHETSGLL